MENYTIRFAKPEELELLPAIEQAAADLFEETHYPTMVGAPNSSEHIDLLKDRVWVAIDLQTGDPVGFAVAYPYDGAVHLNELDVHPEHGRRGIGRLLVETVIDWAREQGAAALTLTTFADIAWNGPFYARLGFRTLEPNVLTPVLRAICKAEAAAGLPVENRICMQLDI